jgi:hypothetical protein
MREEEPPEDLETKERRDDAELAAEDQTALKPKTLDKMLEDLIHALMSANDRKRT